MAQRVSVYLADDITGEEADETVEFELDGTRYQIDLTAKNSQELRETLKPYIDKGRKVAGTARRAPRSRTASDEARNKEIRAWAREQGLAVNERGRIPAEIAARYEAANPK
jgi:hypothetical protein